MDHIRWLVDNEDIAIEMSKNANLVVDIALQPINVYAYWITVLKVSPWKCLNLTYKNNFKEYARRSSATSNVENMEFIPQPDKHGCKCFESPRDEL